MGRPAKVTSGPMTSVSETYQIIQCDTLVLTVAAQAVYASSMGNKTILLQAASGNSGTAYIGNAHNQTIELPAGQSITVAIDASQVYIKGTASDVINWIALA